MLRTGSCQNALLTYHIELSVIFNPVSAFSSSSSLLNCQALVTKHRF